MATIQKQGSENVTIVALGTYTAGVPVNVGTALHGVPLKSAVVGDQVAMAIAGTFDYPKVGGTAAYAKGDVVYWNDATSKATKTASDSRIGVCVKAALIGDTTVEVLIDGQILDAIDTASVTWASLQIRAIVALGDAVGAPTAAQLCNSTAFTISPTVARTFTVPTAANIIAALTGQGIGTWFDWSLNNIGTTAGGVATVTTAAGVTLVGDMAIRANSSASFRALVTSASAVTIFRIDGSVPEGLISLDAVGAALIANGALGVQKQAFKTVTAVADASVIATAAQLLGGMFTKASTTGAQTFTTDTAVAIQTALGAVTAGMWFDFTLTCTAGANDTTVTAGAGVTLVGPAADFLVQVAGKSYRVYNTGAGAVSIRKI